jgi:uncharacterized protein (AIM24 family)
MKKCSVLMMHCSSSSMLDSSSVNDGLQYSGASVQQGFFVDRFNASQGDAVLWPHGHGNAFEVNLAAGEVIDVEPGSWIYRQDSVGNRQQVFGLTNGLLGGSGNLVFNRFTGPGRLGLQSGYYAPFAGGTGNADAGRNPVGRSLGGLFNDRETASAAERSWTGWGRMDPNRKYQDAVTP